MKQFKKYRQNLCLVEFDYTTYVKSYDTLVAKVEGNKLVILGWWSQTTSKHINYVAKELGLQLSK
jgi:hypothetical protein